MSTLTGSSTDAQVWAAYDDNASYEEDGSRTKALAFATACRILLRRRPTSMSRQGHAFAFDASRISDELANVRKWLAANPSSSTGIRTRFADLTEFRD